MHHNFPVILETVLRLKNDVISLLIAKTKVMKFSATLLTLVNPIQHRHPLERIT